MLHPDAVSIVLSSCVNPDERNFYKKTKQWFSYIEKQGFLESPQALKNVLEKMEKIKDCILVKINFLWGFYYELRICYPKINYDKNFLP